MVFDSQLDAHFVNLLESKFKETTFARVDSDHIDKLIQKEEVSKPNLSQDEITDISNLFEAALPSGSHYNFAIENLEEKDGALLITQSEFMRRYREMSAMNGGMNFYGSLPESYTITVNYKHPLISRILDNKKESLSSQLEELDNKIAGPKTQLETINQQTKDLKPEEIETSVKDNKSNLEETIEKIKGERKDLLNKFGKENDLVREITDLALLSNGMLKGEELSKFIKRSLDLIK